MVKKQSTPSEKQSKKPSAKSLRQWLQDAYYVIWSLVGVVILVAVVVATFSSTSLIDMVSSTPQASEAPAQQAPAQPSGPTDDQLECISKEVGKDRLAELEQGAQPEGNEATVIQECLAE